jgi:capsid portal protein
MEFVQDSDSESTDRIEISSASDLFRLKKDLDMDPSDPFTMQEDSLKKVSGLSPAFRRKMGRELSKAFTGREETGTQQNLLAQAVTGYALFDLIEPPYNLEYLSRIYEISTYNYAAINAKVANIVGLGYDFTETKKTNDAFDSIEDPKQLERARRKLNKLKQDLQLWIDSTNDEDTFTQTLIKAYTDYEATGNGYIEISRTTEVILVTLVTYQQRQCVCVDCVMDLSNCFMARLFSSVTLETWKQKIQLLDKKIVQMKLFI